MKRVLMLLALAPLGGCISVLPKPPPAPLVYPLAAQDRPPAQTPAAIVPRPIVIAVQTPNAPRTLAGADIVWTKDGRFAFIDGVTWDGRGPELLQTMLVHTIARSGAVQGGLRSGEGRAQSEIAWDITAFGVTEDAALQARFAAHVNLFSMRGRALIDSLEIDEREALKDRSSGAAALALETAARRGASKIAAWAAAKTPEPEADEPATPERRRPRVR